MWVLLVVIGVLFLLFCIYPTSRRRCDDGDEEQVKMLEEEEGEET